jgi:cytochrome c peroxidase
MAISFVKWIRKPVKAWMGFAATLFVFAGVGVLIGGEPATKAAPAVAGKAASPKTMAIPSVPVPGPLAEPRSLEQIGVPLLQTMAEIPQDNPQTPEKVTLGKKLFFEARLSADGTVACATCHNPDRAFTDGKAASVGFKGRVGQRNAPTILNALYHKAQFWDGRAGTLEAQAILPIVNPSEMGQPSMDAAAAAIASIPEYRESFQRIFNRAPNGPDIARAIASYERSLISFNSPFDRFIAGNANAIDDAAKRGWTIFNTRGRCNLCHASVNLDVAYFTDFDFHNIGIGIIRHRVVPLARKAEGLIKKGDLPGVDRAAIQSDMSVLGRFLVTRKEADMASFKTPSLRNVLVTAPYFHDGSQETLWDVVDHYNKGDGLKNPWLDDDIQPLALTDRDIADLVAFMASLTSEEYKDLGAKELARQHALSLTSRPQRDTARSFGLKPPRPRPPNP